MNYDNLDNLNDSGILRGNDERFRWVYELNMWRNPTIIITVTKILLLCSLFPSLIVFFSSLEDGFTNAIFIFSKVYGICIGIILPIMLVSYVILNIIYGGKYCAVFEMDNIGIKHMQMKKQFKKSQTISMIGVVAGAIAGNVTVMGSNLLAGSKQSLYSKFSKVKAVVIVKKRNVIYLNEALNHNQIYVEDKDFDFVAEFIIEQCKKAKISYK